MAKENHQPIASIHPVCGRSDEKDDIAAIASWLAGQYAAADNKLYGLLLDNPKLSEKICSPKGPTRDNKSEKEQMESVHDLTLKAIETLRLAAISELKDLTANKARRNI